jgi:hypothetical protein
VDFETNVVWLWLNNDRKMYDFSEKLATLAFNDARGDDIFSRTRWAKTQLAKDLREWIDSQNPLYRFENSVYGDLMQATLQTVNWDQLASSVMDRMLES